MNYVIHYVPFDVKDKSNISVLDQSYNQASDPLCILSRLELVLKSYISISNMNTSTVYLIFPRLDACIEEFISGVFSEYEGCKVVFVVPPKKCNESNKEFHNAYVFLKFFYGSLFTEDDRFLVADLSQGQMFQSDPFEEDQLSTYQFIRTCIPAVKNPKMSALIQHQSELYRQFEGLNCVDHQRFFVNGVSALIFLYYRILFQYVNLEEHLRCEVTFLSLLNLVVLKDKILLKNYQGKILVS